MAGRGGGGGEIHCMTRCGQRTNPETLRNTMLHVWIEKNPTKETEQEWQEGYRERLCGIIKTSGRENSRKVSLALKIT